MHNLGGETTPGEQFLNGFREHDGSVFASGTAESDGQVAFAFLNIVGDQIGEQALDAAEKFSGLRKGANVAANFGILAGERPQAGDKVRIGKKAHVEDQVGVGGHPKTIAEAYDAQHQGAMVGILETLGDEVAEFVDVEARGVDGEIS